MEVILEAQQGIDPEGNQQSTAQLDQNRQFKVTSPKAFALCVDSKIVMAKPTAIADPKKRNGSAGVYQNG